MELDSLTISKVRQGLAKKEFSAQELCRAYLNNISRKNPRLFAYLEVFENSALVQAQKIDALIAAGRPLPALAGAPLAVKDNILAAGARCTAGSKVLENNIAAYEATATRRLKEQGAIILGKTNLDEFAMGASTENSAFGPTKNPHDLARVPGGSSGGSAAAVASDMALAALGSDTGGSIRLPAAFCGVVGLKPTYGAVSRYGLIAMASSLDQIGPISKTVEDAEIVFEAIRGKDEKDATSVNYKLQITNDKQYTNYKLQIKNLRIGLPKEYFIKGIVPEVEKAVKRAAQVFEQQGAELVEISLPHTEYALPCYYIIVPCEVSANLARYDGIRYGNYRQITNYKLQNLNLLDVYLKTRQEYLGPEVKRRIMLGTFALSAGYYEAYYQRAMRVRTRIRQDFARAFEKADVLLTPVSPTPAFKIGEKAQDPLTMYLSDIFTVSANLAGLPGLVIPCAKAGQLPIAFQLIGNAFEEEKLLAIGKTYQTLNPKP